MARTLTAFVGLSAVTAISTVLARTSWIIPFNTSGVWLVNGLRVEVPWLTRPMALLTYLGSDPVLFLLAIGIAVWFFRQGYKFEAGWLISVSIFARIAGIVLKLLIQSPRPDLTVPPPYIHVSLDYGFPSGHALMSSVILGAVAIMAVHYSRRRTTGIAIAAVCVILILGIGISRIYLGVHWPNDVIGGYLYGSCILTGAELIRRKKGEKREGSA